MYSSGKKTFHGTQRFFRLSSGVADGYLVPEVDRARAVHLAPQRIVRAIVLRGLVLVEPSEYVGRSLVVAGYLLFSTESC